ncbi:ribonucleoside-diphosphate reductase alpha chain [Methanofollis sp. W23]|uniref:LAGLIDADG family homing endonuclease n=1 Tax=Methanofollis sp. W23 TaxID=2817849 RepID=UPI001AE8CB29|nr:LAGLIDADG family homing endonuclease [Methanofollis sp. W23]MBP2146280.1 ribonucleoside-diphosphate reductase alpha chain [Methanofollis sp. W23]
MTDSVVDSILAARYLRKGEKTFEDICRRVSSALGKDDAEREEFFEAMRSLSFLPNSPTLMNAGTEIGQLSACFTLPVGDSIPEIFHALEWGALIHKSGGGTGYNFSQLRPEGAPVQSTDGVASGPISFMKVFNAATDVIKQGGRRRGANMGILNVWHPDIMRFIHAKKVEGDLSNFNISVMVNDRFMEFVESGQFNKVWITHPYSGEEITVGEIWNGIIDGIWKNGEPGVLFYDEINRKNPAPHLGPIETTNPCVTADTWVMTTEGPRQVADLIGRRFDAVVCGTPASSGPEGFFQTGTRAVLRLCTREGYHLSLTPDHPVCRVASLTRSRTETEWVRAGDLSPGDRLLLHDHRACAAWDGALTEEQGYLLGMLVGDGTLKKDAAVLSVWSANAGAGSVMAHAETCARTLDHRADFSGWFPVDGRDESRLKLSAVRDLAEAMGMAPGAKGITPAIEQASSAGYRGFLAGLFDADGSVQGTPAKGVSVRLSQSDRSLLLAAQRMLLRMGVRSTIYRRRAAGHRRLPDGKGGLKTYAVKSQYDLAVSGENLLTFRERVGFRDEEKAARLDALLAKYSRNLKRERYVATVASVAADGTEAVYDVQVPGVNAFDANGFVAHNCGEQPLLPFESCVLGSINLAKFVKDGAVDEAGLKKMTRMAVRFLDAVIDENVFPIPQIGEATRKTRKIGLGLMGVHDALLMLGMPYDSDEGRGVCEEVMALVNETAIEESHVLAGEKGTFPAFEGSVWGDSEMRNAALTTIAPTGTISLLAGCSSGVEPVFSYAYTRKNTVGKTFMILHPIFEAELRRVVGGMGLPPEEEEAKVKEAIEHVHETGTIRDVAWLPASFRHLFRTALDIDWRDHVRMQAVFQKHVHASISKTINMPNAATREEIAEAVMMAWKSGIKGMTIYRTGSREDVVLALKEKKPAAEKEVKVVTQRPKELAGKTYLGQSGCCRLYITVNLMDGKPWEVFIRTVGSGGCEANSNALGRSISTGLQNGVPYQKFVKQFAKVNCIAALKNPEAEGLSCADVVGKCIDLAASRQTIATLDNWTITEVGGAGTKKKNLCPECGAELDFGEGCNQGTCKNCGWSGCN